jgi:hypothetical protein
MFFQRRIHKNFIPTLYSVSIILSILRNYKLSHFFKARNYYYVFAEAAFEYFTESSPLYKFRAS